MADLDKDIAAYRRDCPVLEQHSKGRWVLYHAGERAGTFDTFEGAAKDAVDRFGRGPYLIRQIGATDFVLPASVAYRVA